MAYITTYSGIDFDVEHFTEDDFDIVDMAHSLSLQCRWSGHCKYFYSVAQHSCHVSDFMEDNKMLGLLHDGSEGYGADMPTPFKALLKDFQKLENRMQNKIYLKFMGRIPTDEEHEYLKKYDRLMLDFEGTLMIPHWSNPIDTSIIPDWEPWLPERAKQEFLNRFRKLI